MGVGKCNKLDPSIDETHEYLLWPAVPPRPNHYSYSMMRWIALSTRMQLVSTQQAHAGSQKDSLGKGIQHRLYHAGNDDCNIAMCSVV